jgi:hypothetical protein
MEKYRYRKSAGALNEVHPSPMRSQALQQNFSPEQSSILDEDDSYVTAHNTGVGHMPVSATPAYAQAIDPHTGRVIAGRRTLAARPATAGSVQETTGKDTIRIEGEKSMFWYTVAEGQRVLMTRNDGRVEVIAGPSKVWRGSNRFSPMEHYVAHPGEFLIIRFRSGNQEHLTGPADCWFDPRIHLAISREEALQLSTKEAIVVYARDDKAVVTRRIEHGPSTFVPKPGEWLHTFSWHGSRGGDRGYQKVPNALVFQKLWMLPDQMYHDVQDVRTADDAVITVRLMLFFELVDVETMLSTSHDPIGDFVNAATSDVIDFTSRHDFESFKKHTDQLNDLGAYRQLTSRASQCGYRINKIVYRGYGAPESLQRMHDEAIEQRTRLQLERATQQQAQELEDFKLERHHARAGKQRTERDAEVAHTIEIARAEQDAAIARDGATRTFEREQDRSDRELRRAQTAQDDIRARTHFTALKELGVDLTALLTQARADQVIELRGETAQAHLHLPEGERRSR